MGVHIDARRRKGLRERVVAHTFESDPVGEKRTLMGSNDAHGNLLSLAGFKWTECPRLIWGYAFFPQALFEMIVIFGSW